MLGLYDIVEPSHSADFEDLYIVTPLSTTDLSRVIYSKTALSSDQQLYLFYQALCGVHTSTRRASSTATSSPRTCSST